MKSLSAIGMDVSRETIERLDLFESLVEKWNKRINLVSRSDAEHVWRRHILDSAQVYQIANTGDHWVDIGSGGGFPGVVCAVLSAESNPGRVFTLIESDQRKATFLRTAARELDLNVEVKPMRIEAAEPQQADILSARALADLATLLGYAEKHLHTNGKAVFMKGKAWLEEVERAKATWHFRFESTNSKTEPDAAILMVEDIHHARPYPSK